MPRVKIGLQIEETSPLVRHLIGSGKGVSEWDGIDPDEIVKVTHTVESSDIQEINPGIYYNIPSITTAKQGDTLFSDDGRLFVYDEAGSRWFLWYTFDNDTAKIHTNNTLKGEGTLDDPLTVNATVVALKGDLNPLLEGTDNGDGTYTFTSADGSTMFTIDLQVVNNPTYGSQVLTDAANISWDMDLGEVAKVTITDNRTIGNPTNLKIGTYVLFVIQDGVGGHTLSFDTDFKWKGGIAPTLTATANAVDILTFVSDGTFLYGAMTDDYS